MRCQCVYNWIAALKSKTDLYFLSRFARFIYNCTYIIYILIINKVYIKSYISTNIKAVVCSYLVTLKYLQILATISDSAIQWINLKSCIIILRISKQLLCKNIKNFIWIYYCILQMGRERWHVIWYILGLLSY